MKTLLIVLLSVVLAGCEGPQEVPLTSLPGCGKLRATGDFDLTILADDNNSLRLSGKGMDQFEWQHDGTTLLLNTTAAPSLKVELSCEELAEVELLGAVQARQSPAGFAQYEKIAVYGRSSFSAVEVSADNLDLRTSGQAALRLDQIVADRVQVLASGQSQQYLAGETQRLEATLTGSAKLSAAALSAQRIELSSSGSSVAEVYPTAHIGGTLNDQAQVGFVSNSVLEVSLEINDTAIARRREQI